MSSARREHAPAPLGSDHTPEAVRSRLGRGPAVNYLRHLVYGAIDGTVTTFAVVAGATGAGLRPGVVVVLGLANLFADGMSMAVGNYLSTRSEEQRHDRARREEERHVELVPDGEREEIRQIFAAKGFEGDALETAVRTVTSDRRRWIETMLREEHGFPAVIEDPLRAGMATFAAFVVAGSVPLLVNVAEVLGLHVARPFAVSGVLTAATFALVGAAKARIVERSRWRAAAETILLGGGAAALAYGIGVLLGDLARG